MQRVVSSPASVPTVLLLTILLALATPLAATAPVADAPNALPDPATVPLLAALQNARGPADALALAGALDAHAAPAARAASAQDLALASLLLGGSDGPLDAATAVALTQHVSRWQTQALGTTGADPAPLVGYERPSEALTALAQRFGLVPSQAEAASLAQLDEVAPAVAAALARFVDAFLALHTASAVAFAHLDDDALARHLAAEQAAAAAPLAARIVDQSAAPGAGLRAAGIDLSVYVPTRDRFLAAAMALRAALGEAPASEGGVCAPQQMAPAFSIDLESCDGVYTSDFALVFDAGGRDTYHNNGGGTGSGEMSGPSSGYHGRCTVPVDALTYAAALVDLGGADDVYGKDGNFRCGGVNGGGVQGTGFLLDDGGDDLYRAFGLGINGGALIGAGALLDLGGDDQYRGAMGARCTYIDCYAGSQGVNGGANLGMGLVFDVSGDDDYLAGLGLACGACVVGSSGVNGGASLTGVAALIDLDGMDEHQAAVGARCLGWTSNDCSLGSLGVNGGSFGGRGFLFSGGSQDDVYEVANGVLCSNVNSCAAGNGGINGGASVSVAFLFDGGGNDRYRVGVGSTCSSPECRVGSDGVNGGGSGLVGSLVDAGGDDLYQAATGSSCTSGTECRLAYWAVNGGGLIGGLGRIVDVAGNDRYDAASGTSCGGASCRMASLGINGGAVAATGALLDGSGNDVFTVAEAASCTSPACEFATFGTNGGVGSSPGGAAQGGVAYLVDGGGTDRYHDLRASCMDCTVVPKEINGAQMDAPLP